MRLAWLSDTHLDHCGEWIRLDLAQRAAAVSDACLITGDITNGSSLELLEEFANDYDKPVYFVLGNHDYWGGSFASIAAKVRAMCLDRPSLIWLDDSAPVTIAPGVQLCGVGGWYDAQFGDPYGADFVMNDWLNIDDLRKPYYRGGGELVAKCLELGVEAAVKAKGKLESTTAPQVIFATHVPPYRRAARHNGKPTDAAHLPWYTCKSMGFVLSRFAKARPGTKLTTLCGHVHSAHSYKQAKNHTVMTAASEYGEPGIAKVFEFGE